MRKKPLVYRDLEQQILWRCRFWDKNLHCFSFSLGDKGYIWQLMEVGASSFSLIVWSQGQQSGKCLEAALEKTLPWQWYCSGTISCQVCFFLSVAALASSWATVVLVILVWSQISLPSSHPGMQHTQARVESYHLVPLRGGCQVFVLWTKSMPSRNQVQTPTSPTRTTPKPGYSQVAIQCPSEPTLKPGQQPATKENLWAHDPGKSPPCDLACDSLLVLPWLEPMFLRNQW